MITINVILYSTGCPKCRVLTKKLDSANINYEVITDKQIMLDKGFLSAPMLEVDGEVMPFTEANNWINKR